MPRPLLFLYFMRFPMTTITLPAYAKLNLTLDILSKRNDGYHDLSMVMQSISLHDDVTVTLTEESGIVCRCGTLPGDDSNLAVKAAGAFFTETGIPPRGLLIDIEKRIPIQAGMAGGSADAAAVLHALRALLAPELTTQKLEAIGAQIGSDVPYCVRGGTVLAEGRGEKLTTLKAAPHFHVVICKPDFPISTPALFKRSDTIEIVDRPDTEGMLIAIEEGDALGVSARVFNVFEAVLDAKDRDVFTIKERLLSLGAAAAAMTGSGPTVFGLFIDESKAKSAFDTLKTGYAQTYLAEFV